MMQEKLLNHLKLNPFVLAPMAGITDLPFRSFMRKQGASVVVSELVSATGIEYTSAKSLALMKYEEVQRPVGIQLFGEDPEELLRAAQVVESQGADFVDLNFGCPVPKVVKKGAGSAVLRDLPLLGRILNQVRSGIQIPLTIKIRTGWDAATRNAHEVCKIAYNEGIAWVAIHGRTRAQGYSGESDWDYIREVKTKSQIPILGNGDIHSGDQAVKRLRESGCDGVMVGRGCLKNPHLFQQALDLWRGVEMANKSFHIRSAFEDLFYHLEQHCAERILSIQAKKFASWYSSGYPGAAQLRRNVFQATTSAEVRRLALDFFAQLEDQGGGPWTKADTSAEDFLMGGHG